MSKVMLTKVNNKACPDTATRRIGWPTCVATRGDYTAATQQARGTARSLAGTPWRSSA